MKKINSTKTILLTISLLILGIGFIMSDGYIEILILGILGIVSLFLLNIQATNIVELSEDNPKVKTFRFLNIFNISIVILCFIFALSSPNNQLSITENNKNLVICFMSVFMMFFGNLSPKIPFNRYLGLRLPWTIRDEETWKIAHKLVGYLSFPIATIMFIASFFFNGDIVGIIGILTWIIVPSIYSFIFYSKKLKGLN
ncbi:SdpI family protein [Romboutsia sp. MSSM.1001216sp_RTP31141st1_G3_RTP31141_220114]|uniref:SdpI family protein n=1 Tax=unclassified Romboutsia TaxID=2626894 RepID=UPI0031B602C3